MAYDNKEILKLMQDTCTMIENYSSYNELIDDLLNNKTSNSNNYAAQLKDLFTKVSELNQIYGEDRPVYLSKEQCKMLEKLLADDYMFYSKDEFDQSKGILATYNGVRIVVEDF